MINNPPTFKGLNIGIPIIIPINGRGFINHGSVLSPTSLNPQRSGEELSAGHPYTRLLYGLSRET